MKFRIFTATCLIGAALLLTGCTDSTPKMEVPTTKGITFTQMEQTEQEKWNDTTTEAALHPVAQEVQLTSGGTATLYTLDTDESPTIGADQITSVDPEVVLNSTAVQLGEYGTIRELAESELYHWTDASEFQSLQYTQPLKVSDTRYVVHLRLENMKIGMEQIVVYTDIGNKIARVDRLWRSIPDLRADKGSKVLDETASYLLSDKTI